MPGSIKAGDKWFICRIDNAPEEEANANLISAAPDMYEALNELYLEYLKISIMPTETTKKVVKALAKAEGK